MLSDLRDLVRHLNLERQAGLTHDAMRANDSHGRRGKWLVRLSLASFTLCSATTSSDFISLRQAKALHTILIRPY